MKKLLATIVMIALSQGCQSALVIPETSIDLSAQASHQDLPTYSFIIGQDLDSIRGYYKSDCCVLPDGNTAYLSIYRLLDGADFGGIGYGPDRQLLTPEGDWGAGRVGAWQSSTEFDPPHLAIGLFIAENEVPGGMADIINGIYDNEIDHLATFAKTVRGQVFLRIGYEFDGIWNVGHDNTEMYKQAYRHIVDRMRASDVNNVLFTWQSGASIIDDIIEQRREDISDWYPGDDYVDWIALSWFTRPDELPVVGADYVPATSRELSDEVVAFARARGKPVMIAEASPQGFDVKRGFEANIAPILDGPSGKGHTPMTPDALWDAWYAPLFEWMNENRDVVRSLAYINANWDSQPMWGPPYEGGFWGDSRLEENPQLAERFNAAIQAWRAGE